MQVPRSARLIQEDNEYALFSFILFRKIVDSFKSEARQKGWQVWGPMRRAISRMVCSLAIRPYVCPASLDAAPHVQLVTQLCCLFNEV